MAILLWNQWNEDWNYQWKCTFVGETRQIIINPGFTDISVKTDIYSGWKEWVALRDNTKFPPAIRSIGGDKISETESAGDLYFLQNGWRIVVNHSVKLKGVLYHDDGIDPYIVNGGGVQATASSIVQNVGGDNQTEALMLELENLKAMIKANQMYILAQ